MRTRYINTTLAVIIILISTTLLIGNRFDATWAGGDGYESHVDAFVGDDVYKRGEAISSGDEWLRVEFGDSTIWMYSDTQIKLVNGRQDRLEIELIQGRIVIDGQMTVSTRDIDTTVDGVATIVHYSWLDVIEAASIEGSLEMSRGDEVLDFTEQALNTTTLPPYEDEILEFDPSSSSASEFYSWSLLSDI